ncbi:MAG: hypothetical protein Q4C89_01395 [Deinococcus sp.]|uniref:hypothetical protein n=1 Tax=Deinococcus sp. TaxID=47478 RepID=UPI0026DD9C0B|nr:hypothetical protein [Deinococcus sp.]MDO4244663.1 hypothetical protein [Deinococcus sp.]
MTGLQFAVLRAYAASLPKTCPTRAKLAGKLWADLPHGGQRSAGRVLAWKMGLLREDGRTLTPEGLEAARDYLGRFLEGEGGAG